VLVHQVLRARVRGLAAGRVTNRYSNPTQLAQWGWFTRSCARARGAVARRGIVLVLAHVDGLARAALSGRDTLVQDAAARACSRVKNSRVLVLAHVDRLAVIVLERAPEALRAEVVLVAQRERAKHRLPRAPGCLRRRRAPVPHMHRRLQA